MPQDRLVRDSAVPLYVQLEEVLREKIHGGEWQPNHRIPSENELNKMYELSRMTVRGVLTKLVNDGLLFRVPGKGTYVSPRRVDAVSPVRKGIREQLESMGLETSMRLLEIGIEEPTAVVRNALRLADGEKVYGVHRVRSAQDEPFSLQHSYIPVRLAPGLEGHRDALTEHLRTVLENPYRLLRKHVDERLRVASPSLADSRHLKIGRSTPILLLEDVVSDGSGTPFEYALVVFRGDKVQLDFTYDF